LIVSGRPWKFKSVTVVYGSGLYEHDVKSVSSSKHVGIF